MLVGIVVLVGKLAREGRSRSRSCTVDDTERPSGRGGKTPSSEETVSSSSGLTGCPLINSTEDGYKDEGKLM